MHHHDLPPARRSRRAGVSFVLLLLPLSSCAAVEGTGAAGSADARPGFGEAVASEREQPARGLGVAELTLEEIFADQQWVARSPENADWSADGRFVFFDREREDSEVVDRYRLDVTSGAIEELLDEELGPLTSPGTWTAAPLRSPVSTRRAARAPQRAFKVHAGNLFLMTDGRVDQITRGRHAVSKVRWSSDATRLFFERDGSWWEFELDAPGEARELARLVPGDAPDPDDDAPDGFRARTQERVIGVVAEDRRRERQEREVEERRRAVDDTRAPEPVFVGAGNTVWRDSLDPTGRYLVALIEPEGQGEGSRDTMPVWLTDDADVDTEAVRPHAGDAARLAHTLRWYDLETGGRVEIPLEGLSGQDDDPLAFLRVGSGVNGSSTNGPNGPRGVRARLYDWSSDGRWLGVQVYSMDDKDRWTCLLDADAATLTEVHRLHDEAWIGSFNEMGWVPGRPLLWFQSEETGWSHLYLHDAERGTTRALTSGAWETDGVVASPDGRWLFFVGNREDHGVHEVYRVPVVGGPVERLTEFGGVTSYELSPDGTQLLCRVSRALEPPELYVQDAVPGATAVRRTFTIERQWQDRPWVEPEFVAVPGRDGRTIPARLYRPPGPATGPRPAVLFVHGAGYLQNAHRGWSRYSREFMFHSFLVQEGFVVLDMDYRASKGYGRDWRTAIWRRMGEPELEDLVDGAAWLAQDLGVDPERIGVYGGSYGGFMTLMALFRAPDAFACGAALRPVTDWAHYNDPYTVRILHTPELDPDAYRRSSPIEYAEGLEDPLLICHGLVDSNVLAKDSVRLTQRLIELGKEDFETMLYPAEGHGFRWPSSWLDEYRRIWKLFDTWLVEPIGARSDARG